MHTAGTAQPPPSLQHHAAYHENMTHKAYTAGPTLAYVTPWNRRGYTLAEDFGCKLDYVSPVWFVV